MSTRPPAPESHPVLNASIDDFEAREFSPTIPELPSQHSGFRSNQTSEYSEDDSARSYSPPAWRKAGSGWFKHQQPMSPTGRGHSSVSPPYPGAEGDIDNCDWNAYRVARRIPLPESPVKGRSPSVSPVPMTNDEPTERARKVTNTADKMWRTPSSEQDLSPGDSARSPTPTQKNYIRFSTSLDVVQRTEPIEAVVESVRKAWHHATRSRYTAFTYSILLAMVCWVISNLLSKPSTGPSPDLIRVAGLAKAFEPVIYYSEAGQNEIETLHDTGTAVWDLGESVRSTNMTSAPMIVEQLDDLSENLKTLAGELTSFFASVDSDVDNIIHVMEWAQRELTAISSAPPSTIGTVWSNTHGVLARAGLGAQSRFLQALLGSTYQQRTKATLEHTFHSFLGVLEEAINAELKYSLRLFGLFEAIDKQFLNLQRTVIREQDVQERSENDLLGSLWTRVVGAKVGELRKFEKNRNLLQSVRERTVGNKRVLQDHHQRLLNVKSNLDVLRQRLVSPLVRSTNASTLSIDSQIQGLEDTYRDLKRTREQQKVKLKEIIVNARSKPISGGHGDPLGIDGR